MVVFGLVEHLKVEVTSSYWYEYTGGHAFLR
jgi:hypothetical protein